MKTKKMIYRVASAAMCLTMLGAGAQVFAATSDSYTGYTHSGELSATITCKINGFDAILIGTDSCTASTESKPDGVKVFVGLSILNKNGDPINGAGLVSGMGDVTLKVDSVDRTSAASAVSTHVVEDDTYGNFLQLLGCTFNQ